MALLCNVYARKFVYAQQNILNLKKNQNSKIFFILRKYLQKNLILVIG